MSTSSTSVKMVDTVGQYDRIRAEINAAIQAVLDSGAYINGPETTRFRDNLASWLDVKKVIPCANGTDALQIALMALNLEPGDEIITIPFTFFATAEVAAVLGLRPVFVDVIPGTFLMDVSQIEAAITPRTKVILPVHLFGQSADMEAIMQIAAKHKLWVIEDNAQAIGADFTFSDGRTQKVGTIGHIGCTSFYPSKNLGAYGDAGAIFTNDEDLAAELLCICNHGSRVRYHHVRMGVNSRLDSIQAAILDVKLRHLDSYNQARIAAADRYDSHFRGIPGLAIPERAANSSHVFHQYTLRVLDGRARRDALKQKLQDAGIPTMVYYPIPLHLQEAYAPYGFQAGDFPVSEALCGQVISLPIHSELDDAQVDFIARSVIQAFQS